MKKKITNSKFGKLDKKDWIKGLIVAGLTGLFSAVLEILQSGLSFDKETLSYLLTGLLTGALGYLTKNTFSNSNDEPFKKEKIIIKNKKNDTRNNTKNK